MVMANVKEVVEMENLFLTGLVENVKQAVADAKMKINAQHAYQAIINSTDNVYLVVSQVPIWILERTIANLAVLIAKNVLVRTKTIAYPVKTVDSYNKVSVQPTVLPVSSKTE